MMRRLRNNRGAAMITAYIFLAVIITLATGYAVSSANELFHARSFVDSKEAFWIAEAGIQEIMHQINIGTVYNNPSTVDGNFSGGNYSVEISKNGSIYTLTSRGSIFPQGANPSALDRTVRQTVQEGSSWPEAFNYALFGNGGLMTIKENGSITGSIFQYGNVTIKENSSVSEYVYTTGAVTSKPSSVYTQGVLPDPMPTLPVLNTSVYFAPEITQAVQSGINGNQTYNSIDLTGGNIYVNGDVELSAGGLIQGPGVLIASGKITIKEDSTLGNDVTIIAGGELNVKERTTVGSGFVLYSSSSVQIKENGSGNPSGIVLTPGNVTIKEDGNYTGIIYAGGTVMIKENSVITGSVVAGATQGDDIVIKEGSYVTHNASLLPANIPPGFTGSGSGGALTVLNWEEIVS